MSTKFRIKTESIAAALTPSKYTGNDNHGKPKSEYLDRIKAMNDDALFKETKDKICLSAYANNNPWSDYHWHVDALYDEWHNRKKGGRYGVAHKAVMKAEGY